MIAINAVENLLSDRRSVDEPQLRKGVQLTLQRANAQAIKLARDLSIVKGLIRVTVEEAQDRSACLPEQYICQRASFRSHNESNCTHFESRVKA